ncbi:lipopolysaccharide kinase InaA family protein [Pseudomonas sp. Gutcm_11s]|uniref:lipopolysaccharide kinase InaA family protein n=1 Tax=Pseudomonas sp. Gutcm_11s TaxID=3026088 RepID=UPI0023624A2E|nr:lipopolysaccharide kinase InaA family protein [Pseudomonas sp. Gutcm_11s]MDD0844707.1 lipopolysaccharide kinase InaA family protein [Pseudomonas sp. Gutcm_11s]
MPGPWTWGALGSGESILFQLSSAGIAGGAQFERWWQLQGEWVEAPNQRRGGESGVQRLHSAEGHLLYAKRQVGHLCRSLAHPFGRPTVLRERDALDGLSRLGIRVPRLIYCGASYQAEEGWRGLLVSEALEGFSDIESWYAAGGDRGGEQHAVLLQQIGATLARMHLGRWQHGCLYAKHVFVKVTPEGVEVALLDLEKSRRRFSRKRAAQHDLRQLRRHSPWGEGEWQQLLQGYALQWGGELPQLG